MDMPARSSHSPGCRYQYYACSWPMRPPAPLRPRDPISSGTPASGLLVFALFVTEDSRASQQVLCRSCGWSGKQHRWESLTPSRHLETPGDGSCKTSSILAGRSRLERGSYLPRRQRRVMRTGTCRPDLLTVPFPIAAATAGGSLTPAG